MKFTPEQKEYIERLELGLRHWEDTHQAALKAVEEANRWRDQLENRRSFQAYKRLMRLLGKKVDL